MMVYTSAGKGKGELYIKAMEGKARYKKKRKREKKEQKKRNEEKKKEV